MLRDWRQSEHRSKRGACEGRAVVERSGSRGRPCGEGASGWLGVLVKEGGCLIPGEQAMLRSHFADNTCRIGRADSHGFG